MTRSGVPPQGSVIGLRIWCVLGGSSWSAFGTVAFAWSAALAASASSVDLGTAVP